MQQRQQDDDHRILWWIAEQLVLVLLGSDGPTVDYSKLTGTLNGSGSSFQDAFDQKAKTEFAKVASGVTVNYTKSGSSAGKQDLANQVVQFAGTDSLIKDADKPTFKGGDVLYFPTVGAPITVSFNVTGVDKLKLSPDVLAGIFQGDITTWNDAKIAADNSGVTLPSTAIAVVHRSDGSGTTSNFTKFLKAASPTVWKLDSGDTVNWPASTQGAEKNSGVASLIKTTDGAIGYVDLADAVNADLNARLGEERRRQLRRSDARRRQRRAGRRDGEGRPDLRPDQRQGCRVLPDHVADVDHRVRQADRRRRRQR